MNFDLLFDKTEKVISWAVGITLSIIIMSMTSCWVETTNSDNALEVENSKIQGEYMLKLSEMGYHPVAIRCAIRGWSSSTSHVCLRFADPETMKEIKEHIVNPGEIE